MIIDAVGEGFRLPITAPWKTTQSLITDDAMRPISLLMRLRAETRTEHHAIEQTLALTDDALTQAGYQRVIKQFYGFYKPVENRLAAHSGEITKWLDLKTRQKALLLQTDLKILDHKDSDVLEPLRFCSQLPQLSSLAECFGCLYVLEGATLGGVLISRHIQEKLGVMPASGGSFFHGYGERTGEMWHEFRAALTAFDATTDQQDQVIMTARATFDTLRHWCEKE